MQETKNYEDEHLVTYSTPKEFRLLLAELVQSVFDDLCKYLYICLSTGNFFKACLLYFDTERPWKVHSPLVLISFHSTRLTLCCSFEVFCELVWINLITRDSH